MFKSKIATFSLFLLFLIIIFYLFRTLFFNFGNNLTSWLDIPFIIWVLEQNVDKIQSLDLGNIFETNAFYPNKLTLLYSDVLITQSIIYYIFSLFFKNIILVFNFTLIATLILDYWSLFVFWSLFTKNKFLQFLAALFFIFSPFFFYQFGHFQMMSYWPLFFSLYFLLRQKESLNFKDSFFCGLFLSLQFLASVYLSVFLIFLLGLKLLLDLIFDGRSLLVVSKKLAVIFGVFLLSCGFFVKGYLDMKKMNNFKRDSIEYIIYAAHITDYFFTTGIDTALNRVPIVHKWNSFNHHGWGERAGFPGFLLLVLSVVGIFGIVPPKDKKPWEMTAAFGKNEIFFLALMFIGFVFSLGTKISFNGTPSPIPNIYYYLVKFVPFLDSIRATARWSFLFYLGLIWFSIKGLENIINRDNNIKLKYVLILTCLIIFAIESLPVKIESHAEEYYSGYSSIESLCKEKKRLLLELPVTHLDYPSGVINGLNYISKVLIASTLHGCYLYNGYSGFEPSNIASFRSDIVSILDNGDIGLLVPLLKKEKIEIVKVNDHRWDHYMAVLVRSGDLEQIDANIFLVK